jgi:cell division control protein 6
MISNYLSELEMQGLISAQISGKYVRGNTRLIKLGYPPKEIKDIIKNSWK